MEELAVLKSVVKIREKSTSKNKPRIETKVTSKKQPKSNMSKLLHMKERKKQV